MRIEVGIVPMQYADKLIEIVNLRVRAIGYLPQIIVPQINLSKNKQVASPMKLVHVQLNGLNEKLPLHDFDNLIPEMQIAGPALIVSTDTTILVNKGDVIHVDKYQNLLIDINLSDE